MKTPLVSVTMIVCNVERFLAEAIEGVLNQTFRDFEFVIVDFGSSDASPSIIRRYQEKDQRIRFDTIPMCNLAEARTACCLRAQGKYLALLDADDVALPDRLMRQVEYLESHPEIGLVGSAHYTINQEGRRLRVEGHAADDGDIRNTLKNGCPFQPCSVTMRFADFQAVKGYRRAFGGIDGAKAISYSEDFDLWLRLTERCRMAKLGEPLACYRIHTGQLSSQKLTQLSVGQCVARASARLREQGRPDPVDSADSITPELLAELGVTEADVQNEVQLSYHNRVLTELRADGPGSALPLVKGMLAELAQSKRVSDSVAAETWFTAARAYWGRGETLYASKAIFKAQAIYPAFAGKLVRRASRRLTQLLIRRGSMTPATYLHSLRGSNGATTQR